FSSFARMPKPAKEEADLRDILRDAVFLREMGTTHVEFIRELGEAPLTGMFDARMLGQAFGNLVKNAVEAIESVPGDQERDGRKVWVRAHLDSSRDTFVVDIIDNGSGLPAENRHRILEPYMTMREKGTGLGLAIVKKIIEEHGGQLELHDAPSEFDNGRGAMIRVLLPHVVSVGGAETGTDKEFAYGV
ncbi:MAG TPA: ATP-binding protein, partial [Pseudorhizobium sp.]|nr:ATP-binding protein [Pseudorhizobium sp.]